MRVIRSAGQNVSPSDDGRLYDQIFTDGLFEDTAITHLGVNNIALGAMYGIICGRDFTAEAQTVAVELPEDDAGTTGYIYVEIDTSSDDVITIGSALDPFTPTYEDLNTNGAIAQMIIATYVANSVAVTSVSPAYQLASAGSVLPGSTATLEADQAVSNHSVGEFILLHGQLYKVTSAITAGQSIVPGTNVTATSAGDELTSLNSNLIKAVHLPFSSFVWNASQNRYVLSDYHPTFNTLIGYLIYGTNGMAVYCVYYYAQGNTLSVDGLIPSSGSKIDNSYHFDCYELGY